MRSHVYNVLTSEYYDFLVFFITRFYLKGENVGQRRYEGLSTHTHKGYHEQMLKKETIRLTTRIYKASRVLTYILPSLGRTKL